MLSLPAVQSSGGDGGLWEWKRRWGILQLDISELNSSSIPYWPSSLNPLSLSLLRCKQGEKVSIAEFSVVPDRLQWYRWPSRGRMSKTWRSCRQKSEFREKLEIQKQRWLYGGGNRGMMIRNKTRTVLNYIWRWVANYVTPKHASLAQGLLWADYFWETADRGDPLGTEQRPPFCEGHLHI